VLMNNLRLAHDCERPITFCIDTKSNKKVKPLPHRPNARPGALACPTSFYNSIAAQVYSVNLSKFTPSADRKGFHHYISIKKNFKSPPTLPERVGRAFRMGYKTSICLKFLVNLNCSTFSTSLYAKSAISLPSAIILVALNGKPAMWK